MNMNLKLGPLHLSTKPEEIARAIKEAWNSYAVPVGKLIKDKLNDMIEKREAARRARLEEAATDEPALDAEEEVDVQTDFDDAEVTDDEAEGATDPIARLSSAAEPDCED